LIRKPGILPEWGLLIALKKKSQQRALNANNMTCHLTAVFAIRGWEKPSSLSYLLNSSTFPGGLWVVVSIDLQINLCHDS